MKLCQPIKYVIFGFARENFEALWPKLKIGAKKRPQAKRTGLFRPIWCRQVDSKENEEKVKSW